MQDITPPKNRRSIRNIESPRRARMNNSQSEPSAGNGNEESNTPPHRTGSTRSGWLWKGVIGIVVGLVVIFFISIIFSKAHVRIVPEHQAVELEEEYTAYRNGAQGDVTWSGVTIKDSSTTELEATGEEEVVARAGGVITVYNEYSEEGQTLVANTRFESPQGHIYRIAEAVTVPGMSDAGDPGVVEVEVTADEPGEQYNIGPAEFTIPGFAGAPQFESMYARSSDPFTGGAKGVTPVVSEEDRTTAEEELRNSLEESLRSEVSGSIPADLVLLDGGSFLEFESGLEMNEDDQAVLTVTATLHGLLFEKDQLARRVAERTIEEYDNAPVRIDGLSGFSVEPVGTNSGADLEDIDTLSFTLQGEGTVVWALDEEALKKRLEGLRVNQAQSIFAEFDAIRQATASVNPPWRFTFPGAVDITISQEYGETAQ